jgi:hypothetical protein
MPIKLYISQANQAHNAGPGGYTERAGMDAISKATAAVIAKDARFTVKRNSASGVDTAAANCDQANAWGADYYVALHSNAGMKGTVVFHYSTSAKGRKLAEALQAAIAPLSPGAEAGDRVQTKDGFIEIHRPNAPAVLIELEAHDWAVGTSWLTGKRPAIARALYEGICKGVGLKPLPVKPLTTGKVVLVPVPTVKPKWWAQLTAWVKLTKTNG